jgi:hypothetical protein
MDFVRAFSPPTRLSEPQFDLFLSNWIVVSVLFFIFIILGYMLLKYYLKQSEIAGICGMLRLILKW